MKNSDVVKILTDAGLSFECAHEVIGEIGEALTLEPEIGEMSATLKRVIPAESLM